MACQAITLRADVVADETQAEWFRYLQRLSPIIPELNRLLQTCSRPLKNIVEHRRRQAARLRVLPTGMIGGEEGDL